jgi:hypothetical protein
LEKSLLYAESEKRISSGSGGATHKTLSASIFYWFQKNRVTSMPFCSIYKFSLFSANETNAFFANRKNDSGTNLITFAISSQQTLEDEHILLFRLVVDC